MSLLFDFSKRKLLRTIILYHITNSSQSDNFHGHGLHVGSHLSSQFPLFHGISPVFLRSLDLYVTDLWGWPVPCNISSVSGCHPLGPILTSGFNILIAYFFMETFKIFLSFHGIFYHPTCLLHYSTFSLGTNLHLSWEVLSYCLLDHIFVSLFFVELC